MEYVQIVNNQFIMNTYQIDTLDDNSTKFEQRKQAMERILKRQNISHWTDEELDNLRYECLKERHQ